MASPNGTAHRVAVVQQPPVLLDREASLARALDSLDEAVGNGAELVTFPETYLPGYPEYIWGLRPGDDFDLSQGAARAAHGQCRRSRRRITCDRSGRRRAITARS